MKTCRRPSGTIMGADGNSYITTGRSTQSLTQIQVSEDGENVKTLLDYANYIYQSHLGGEDSQEQPTWVQEATAKIQNGELLGTVLTTVTQNIAGVVDQIKAAGKIAIVHLDLVDGLAPKDVSVDFIAGQTKADGIISTKSSLIRYAHQKGLLTIQRYFLLDSRVLENIAKTASPADFLEVLPGVMPKIIHLLAETTGKPIIAGGMIRDKEDVLAALSAGAVAISSTNSKVWFVE